GGKDSPGSKALAQLLCDHVESDKLGPVCMRLSFGFREEYESFLRAVLEKNPHKDVRGLTCLALAHFLNNRLQRIDLLEDRPEGVDRYEKLFGKDYVAKLRRRGHDKLASEAEAVFEQAIDKYGDVKIPEGLANFGFAQPAKKEKITVGDKAKALLFELR